MTRESGLTTLNETDRRLAHAFRNITAILHDQMFCLSDSGNYRVPDERKILCRLDEEIAEMKSAVRAGGNVNLLLPAADEDRDRWQIPIRNYLHKLEHWWSYGLSEHLDTYHEHAPESLPHDAMMDTLTQSVLEGMHGKITQPEGPWPDCGWPYRSRPFQRVPRYFDCMAFLQDAGADFRYLHELIPENGLQRPVLFQKGSREAMAHLNQYECYFHDLLHDALLLRAQETLQKMTALPPARRMACLLDSGGKPRAALLRLCSTGIAGELLQPVHWQGHGAEAMRIFNAMPSCWQEVYREGLDMIGLNREHGSICVATRVAAAQKQERRRF